MWHEVWEDSNTPFFHKEKVVPFILQFQSEILPKDKRTAAIFIPLCGKAAEIKFFHELGATIIGTYCLLFHIESPFKTEKFNERKSKLSGQ